MSDGVEAKTTSAAASATTGASTLRGGAWNAASYLLPTLYVVVVSIVVARELGPDRMGQYSFVAFARLSAVMLFTGGLPIALTRFVGETVGSGRPGAMRALVAWAWRIEMIAALGGGAMLAVVGVVRPDLRSAWTLAAISCAVGIMAVVPNAALVGLQRWRDATITGLVTGLVGMVATVAVVRAGGDIPAIFAVEIVVVSLHMLWASGLARRAVTALAPMAAADPELTRRAGRYAAWASVEVVLGLIVWKRSEVFFLDRYGVDADIAIYSIAFVAFAALARVPEGISQVTYPAFATLAGAGATDRIRSGFGRSLRFVTIVSLPLVAGAMAVGPAALRVIYGDEYRDVEGVLIVLLLAFPLVAVFQLGVALLQGLGRQRTIITIFVAGTVVNLALDVTLIPAHGAIGAAAANTTTQIAAALAVAVAAVRAVAPVRMEPARVARTAVAAVATGLAARVLVATVDGAPGVALAVGGGVVVFAVAGRALRFLPADDGAWLADTLGGRLGGLPARACRLVSAPARP